MTGLKLWGLCLSLLSASLLAESYPFEVPVDKLSTAASPIIQGPNQGPLGTVSFNQSYFIKNGKPWLPVMGELHFSRVPETEWDEYLTKMKRCGIDVIATYVFWNHHEKERDQWQWDGRRNLQKFAAACRKHELLLWVRIGPWCHGEALWGGFPQYIQKGPKRNNNAGYLDRVDQLYGQIGARLKGMMFKDGGPVIGIQLENEYPFTSANGYAHMKKLRELALKHGMNAPFFSATLWPASHPTATEFLLGFGGYPEAPWRQNLDPRPHNAVFTMRPIKPDPDIGSDTILHQVKDMNPMCAKMPLMSVELGGGNQITWHRRPRISGKDCPTMALCALGSGSNGMGYYMFAGGINPPTSGMPLQESRKTGYPNDCPLINYDFQSPIGSEGQINPAYAGYEMIHRFVATYGSELCQLPTVFPEKLVKSHQTDQLRSSVRGTTQSGFIFVNNYQRMENMQPLPAQMALKMGEKTLLVPEKPLTLPAGYSAIWPYQMKLKGFKLRYATAMPVGEKSPGQFEFYLAPEGDSAEFVFDLTDGVKRLILTRKNRSAVVKQGNQKIRIELVEPATADLRYKSRKCQIKVAEETGKRVNDPTANQVTDWRQAGPRYGLTFQKDEAAAVWDVKVDKRFGGYLHLNYMGDSCAVYQDGQLIQDDFWSGQPLRLRVSRIPDPSKPLKVVIYSIHKNYPIYFEPEQKKLLPETLTAKLFSAEQVREILH